MRHPTTRGERRACARAYVCRRVRFMRRYCGETWGAIGRLRKRHPLDCGVPRCPLCHSERRGRPVSIKWDKRR
jgi:hypothetical protein